MKCAIKYIASHFSYSFDGIQIILDNDVISIIKIATDAFIYALEMAYKEYKGDDSVELPFNKFLRTSKYFISDGLIYTNEDGGSAALIDNVQSQIRLNAESGKQWNLPWRNFKEEPIKCELIDFDDEKVFLFNVVFIGEIFNLSMIYNEKKLRLINFKLVYESYDEFDLKMNGLVGYFDKTQFLNKKVDDVKPYTEYIYNWGVISVYSDLSLNICFSVRWGKEC